MFAVCVIAGTRSWDRTRQDRNRLPLNQYPKTHPCAPLARGELPAFSFVSVIFRTPRESGIWDLGSGVWDRDLGGGVWDLGSGFKSYWRHLDECEGEWSDPDGQDLAPIKDATVTLEIIMGLNYIYNLNYADYKKDDPRHKVINEWFKPFYERIPPAKKFYMGNSAAWYFPNIALRHNSNKKYKSLVKKLVKGAGKWILDDGSIRDRTTRGNRALWYHHNGLGEAFHILEIANAADVKLPKN